MVFIGKFVCRTAKSFGLPGIEEHQVFLLCPGK